MQELEYKRKGNKLIVNQDRLNKYLDTKLRDLGMFMSNVLTALVILSIMVVIQTFKASDVYLYGLILLPLIARGFIYTRIERNLRKRFAELIQM